MPDPVNPWRMTGGWGLSTLSRATIQLLMEDGMPDTYPTPAPVPAPVPAPAPAPLPIGTRVEVRTEEMGRWHQGDVVDDTGEAITVRVDSLGDEHDYSYDDIASGEWVRPARAPIPVGVRAEIRTEAGGPWFACTVVENPREDGRVAVLPDDATLHHNRRSAVRLYHRDSPWLRFLDPTPEVTVPSTSTSGILTTILSSTPTVTTAAGIAPAATVPAATAPVPTIRDLTIGTFVECRTGPSSAWIAGTVIARQARGVNVVVTVRVHNDTLYFTAGADDDRVRPATVVFGHGFWAGQTVQVNTGGTEFTEGTLTLVAESSLRGDYVESHGGSFSFVLPDPRIREYIRPAPVPETPPLPAVHSSGFWPGQLIKTLYNGQWKLAKVVSITNDTMTFKIGNRRPDSLRIGNAYRAELPEYLRPATPAEIIMAQDEELAELRAKVSELRTKLNDAVADFR